ncbi:MAG TPA: 3-phenylpropionate/cinnamic acid dioxygenase subunit beta [Acidimicrobiales bacterium]|nr:3-phenylpropionate/cinnamic acid dioxygenase subunit beta [Acidimicrobiales bacterium]
MTGPATAAVDVALGAEVAAFLFREARLLDEERYEEWLELLTDDVHYWVPGIENRYRRDPAGAYGPDRMAYFDDDLRQLRLRVLRFTSDSAWAEDPPTRHLHVVGNVEVETTEHEGEYVVHSSIVNYRSRGEHGSDVLFGRRRDLLRRTGQGLRLARRRVVLAHNVLPSKNLSTFL